MSLSAPFVPSVTLQSLCDSDHCWSGCLGFGLLLVLRACTSLCFAWAARCSRSTAGRSALVFLTTTSFCLHLVRRVLPFVPVAVPASVMAAAQVADTAGITGVAFLVTSGSPLGGVAGAVLSVLLELLIISEPGGTRHVFETWCRRCLRASAAAGLPLMTLWRLRRRPWRDVCGYLALALLAGAAFPVMVIFTGSTGILWQNTLCALVWHASAALLVHRSLQIMTSGTKVKS